jgi:hypothetical protein
MHGGHQMQGNQITNTVQLDVTIDHTSILLRMVEHIKHAMIVEHARGVTVLIKVQLMQLLKHYNNLNNRGSHPLHNLLIQLSTYPTNLLTTPPVPLPTTTTLTSPPPQQLDPLLDSAISPEDHDRLERVREKWNAIQLESCDGCEREWFDLGVIQTVETGDNLCKDCRKTNTTIPQGTTMCIQGQVVLISPHSPRWKKCSSHLYMH